MLEEEAGDLLGIADELDRRALTHEKVIAHLDLPRARVLRGLASRIRRVVTSSEGDGDRDAVHGEVVGLRLEAMCSLLEDPLPAPPPVSAHPAARASGEPTPIGRMRRKGT